MSDIDPMVSALVALCNKEGGYKTVADKAKISPDNLWQIISGTKLPSGNPRGVGPNLRAKLNAAFPNWIAQSSALTTLPQSTPQTYKPNMPLLHAGRAGAAMDLGVTIESLRAHLRGAGDNKDAVGALLLTLAKDPENEKAASALQLMLDTAFAHLEKRQA